MDYAQQMRTSVDGTRTEAQHSVCVAVAGLASLGRVLILNVCDVILSGHLILLLPKSPLYRKNTQTLSQTVGYNARVMLR